MKKLNVGSGTDIRKDWINLDMHDTYNPDVIFNLKDIYEGKKLPFEDNSMDYIYCSHVLEDFLNPMPIIREFIRICKVGGKIEIRTPSETNIWLGNPYHKRPYSLRIFRGIPNRKHYGEKYNIEIEKLFYYTSDKSGGFLLNLYKNFFIWLYNLLGDKIVENTPLEYFMRLKDVGVVYKKIK